MFRLLKKDTPSIGSVYFRGNLPPRAEEFEFLRGSGVEVARLEDAPGVHWRLRLRHRSWGEAEMVALRDFQVFPPVMVDVASGLSNPERDEAKAAGTGVSLKAASSRANMLADRKNLLRYMRAVMGDDGVVAVDHTSELFWSRSRLDAELWHDADLDVEALYTVHAVADDPPAGEDDDGEEGEPRARWIHTHGLANIGAFDFDILDASSDVLHANDALRALAFAILEGKVGPSTPEFMLAHPGGRIRMVPVAEFHRAADPAEAAFRDNDENHNTDRSVVCEPARGLLRRFSKSVRLSKFFRGEIGDGTTFQFSPAASRLMADRALATISVLRTLMGEWAEFEFPVMVKLGYPTDGAKDETDREHMWFEVHELLDGAVDATLRNQPYGVSSLRAGDRGVHDVTLRTDWAMLTPMGTITPRDLHLAWQMRSQKDAMHEMVAMIRAMDAAIEAAGEERE